MGIPILVYHDIDPSPRLGSLHPTLRQFEAEMRYLAEEGYRTVTPAEAVGGRSPEKSVALTFDDAYEGVWRHALPVLARHGFTATVFVVTGYVGRPCAWDLNLRWMGARHMGWEGIREVDRAGWAVGSHTVRHPDLTALDPSRAEEELRRSRSELEDALGKSVDALSYPFGRYSAAVKAATKSAGYRLACGIRARRGDSPGDPLAIARIPVRSIDLLADFRAKVRPGGPGRFQDWKEAFLSACNRSSLFARRAYDRRVDAPTREAP